MSNYKVNLVNEEYTNIRYFIPSAYLSSRLNEGIRIERSSVTLKTKPKEIVEIEFNLEERSRSSNYNYHYDYSQHCVFKIIFDNHLHIMCPNYTYRVTCRATTVDDENILLFENEMVREKNSIEFQNYLKLENTNGIKYITFDIHRFNKEQHRQKYDLEKFLNEFLLNGHYSDVIITAGDKILNAHKYVLSQQSQVFKNMFENDMLEKQNGKLKIDDFDADVVQEMLLYMYTYETDKLETMSIELFKIAHKYEIDKLKNKCMEFFLFNVNSENVASILEISELYELNDLVNGLKNFIINYEEDIIKTSEYQEYLYSSLNINKVASTLILCEKYLELKDLESKTFAYVKEHIQEVLQNEEFLKLFESHPKVMRKLVMYIHK